MPGSVEDLLADAQDLVLDRDGVAHDAAAHDRGGPGDGREAARHEAAGAGLGGPHGEPELGTLLYYLTGELVEALAFWKNLNAHG